MWWNKIPTEAFPSETVPESQLLTVGLICWLSQPLTLSKQWGSFSWAAVKANKRKSCQDKLSGRTCWNSISRTWNAYGPGWHQGVMLAGSQYPRSNRLQPLTSHDLGRCTFQHISNYPHLHFTFVPWPRLLYTDIWKKKKKKKQTKQNTFKVIVNLKCDRLMSWNEGIVTHSELMLEIFYFIYFYVYGYFICLHICAPHVCSVWGGQQRPSGPLELESQMHGSYQCELRFELEFFGTTAKA